MPERSRNPVFRLGKRLIVRQITFPDDQKPGFFDRVGEGLVHQSGKRPLIRGAVAGLALLLFACLFYCLGIPLLTGQACFDFLSGHVPPRALSRFLDRTFAAVVAEDYEWLATVSAEGVLEELRAAQQVVTTDYEIVLSDNLTGLYEYHIRFSSGAVVYVTLRGTWHACPDFIVTDEEIVQNIELTSIEIQLETDQRGKNQ